MIGTSECVGNRAVFSSGFLFCGNGAYHSLFAPWPTTKLARMVETGNKIASSRVVAVMGWMVAIYL